MTAVEEVVSTGEHNGGGGGVCEDSEGQGISGESSPLLGRLSFAIPG